MEIVTALKALKVSGCMLLKQLQPVDNLTPQQKLYLTEWNELKQFSRLAT
jgi:hypothetical protein